MHFRRLQSSLFEMFFRRHASIFFLFIAAFLPGCSNGLTDNIQSASHKTSRAFQNSLHDIYNAPIELLTRYNPSQCDENLTFEVQINGNWRHIFISGSQESIQTLNKLAFGANTTPFEASWLFTKDLYTSSCGQQFYSLTPQNPH